MTLDLISSHDMNVRLIRDMTVMRETGIIVVSTGYFKLFQFSLQEGSLIEKQIERQCKHVCYNLFCVQVAGQEYLAVSCEQCADIKLMNINKQKLSSDYLIRCNVVKLPPIKSWGWLSPKGRGPYQFPTLLSTWALSTWPPSPLLSFPLKSP